MATGFFVKLTSWPPLGELLVLRPETAEVMTLLTLAGLSLTPDQIEVVVRLEWAKHGGRDIPWDVVLWHRDSATSGLTVTDWACLPLLETKSDLVDFNDALEAEAEYARNFRVTLPFKEFKSYGSTASHECFTIRYRTSPFAFWHDMKQDHNIQDGELVVQRPVKDSPNLDDYIKLEADWKLSRLGTDKGVVTFIIESLRPTQPYAKTAAPAVEEFTLGQIQHHARWFSIVRYQQMWLGPRQGKSNFSLTEPALAVSFLMESGHHFTLVALSGVDDMQTSIRSMNGDTLVVSARNDGSGCASCRILGAVSLNHESSMSAAMAAARAIIVSSPQSPGLPVNSHLGTALKASQNIPPLADWYDGLAFCTWNSLGVKLSPDRILGALDSLTAHGIYPTSLIIDDNWQTLGDSDSNVRQGMKRFEANHTFFPDGLKRAVDQIRAKHPYLEDIAVWHALLGYWGGIQPNSELTQQYKTTTVKVDLFEHGLHEMIAIDPQDVHRWYDDFYGFLTRCGVTGVKTDVQCQLDLLRDPGPRASFSRSYQSAWTAAHLKHFGGKAISCMSMIPQILFSQFLPVNGPKLMLRNSDDFYPEYPSSHPFHVFVNAHNSLFTRNLNALPDWDMFQTKQEYGGFHGAARCLSGAPIYITDTPGEHDVELLEQMTAVSPTGRIMAVRPEVLGRATFAYDSFAEGTVLRIGTSSRKTGILGLFNTSAVEIRRIFSIRDIPEATSGRKYLLRSHKGGHSFGPVDADANGVEHLMYITLQARAYEILTAFPVETVGQTLLAVLGLLGKMTGVAAVTGHDVKQVDSQVIITVVLKALGRLGIWLDGPGNPRVAGKVEERDIVAQDVTGDLRKGRIFQIDILEAWKSVGNRGKRDVTVEIVVS